MSNNQFPAAQASTTTLVSTNQNPTPEIPASAGMTRSTTTTNQKSAPEIPASAGMTNSTNNQQPKTNNQIASAGMTNSTKTNNQKPITNNQIASAGMTGLTKNQQPTTNNQQQTLARIKPKRIAISKAAIEKFQIPLEFLREHPVLVDLILKTESMKDPERQHWFKLLPIMTPEQVAKLQKILQDEKDKLAELDKKYSQEVAKLSKRTSTWSPEKFRKKRLQSQKQEQIAQAQEKNQEADILKELEAIR